MLTAFALGRKTFRNYRSKFSRRDFTRPQLFAVLVLKEFEKKSFRGVEALLIDCPEWCAAIGLHKVPDHTTLCRAAAELLKIKSANRFLDHTIKFVRSCKLLGKFIALGAMDGTGYESHHASAYYVRRCAKGRKNKDEMTYRHFPKLGIAIDTKTHLILAFEAGVGPSPDILHFERVLLDGWRRADVRKMALDAGYDAEWVHDLARREMRIKTLIPSTIGRPTRKPPTGRWRRRMRKALSTKRKRRKSGYTQRWQSETVNSMMKRNTGSALRGRTDASRNRELALKVVTHNVAIRKRVATEQG